MSEIVDFLNVQYDRIEKRERDTYTIIFGRQKHCPVCGRPFEEWTEALHADGEATFEPCGHSIPIADFTEQFGESNPDALVLADLESKRRVAASCQAVIDRDEHAMAKTLAALVLHDLAAPFSGEPATTRGGRYDGLPRR